MQLLQVQQADTVCEANKSSRSEQKFAKQTDRRSRLEVRSTRNTEVSSALALMCRGLAHSALEFWTACVGFESPRTVGAKAQVRQQWPTRLAADLDEYVRVVCEGL